MNKEQRKAIQEAIETSRRIAPIVELLKDRDNVEALCMSVCMRLNWIETGNVILSAEDVKRQIKAGMKRNLNELSQSQRELVERLKVLKESLFNGF